MTENSTQFAIQAKGVGKRYVLGGAEQQYDTFRDLLTGIMKAPFSKYKKLSGQVDEDLFWALRNVDFTIPAGQITGVIGRNGAGKSTLLKVLSRITSPTSGRVEIRGRVASLLEVGSGFHPELTGRENIYMNASILGMRRTEVNRKLDDIVQFAEVERFLDTPVKRYSSGMYVRLAFSVAAHVEPDVLLVDEVLAVGDAKFQQRCIGKMSEVGKQGRTVLFVSHNMGLIQDLCSHSLYLKDGQVEHYGTTSEVLPMYLSDGTEQRSEWISDDVSSVLRRVRLIDESGEPINSAGYLSSTFAEVEVCPDRPDSDFIVALRLTDELGRDVLTSWDTDTNSRNTRVGESYRNLCELPRGLLRPGQYFVTVMVRKLKHGYIEMIEEANLEFEVTNIDFMMNRERFGVVLPTLNWECELV